MRILVVEEVGFVRHNLEQLLKRYEHDVTVSVSCERAAEVLRKDHLIDVVIAPVTMPGLNGVDLFREARQIERMDDAGENATFHFLLTTIELNATDTKALELIQQAQDLGISEILVKPIDSQALISALEKIENPDLAQENVPEEAASTAPSTLESSELTQDGESKVESASNASEIQVLREIRKSLAATSNEIASRIQQIDEICKTTDA